MIPIKGRLERYKRIFYTFYNYKRHKSVLGINLFLGGESLLHKEISNMIVYARSEGKNFRIKSSSYTPCMFLWYSMSILWDGRVVPCCIDFKGEYILGDVKKESLLDIWNGERLVELRRKMIKKRYKEVNLCKGCDVLFKPTIFGIPVRSLKGLWSLFAGNE